MSRRSQEEGDRDDRLSETTGGHSDEDLSEEERLEAERLAAERSYWNVSRGLAASLLFVLPLLLVYELVLIADVNAAAIWVKMPMSWLEKHPAAFFGRDNTVAINAAAIFAVLVAVVRLKRRGGLHPGMFASMFAESCVYALLIGPVVLLPMLGRWEFGGFDPHLDDFARKIAMSAGAGLYEELLFRFILLSVVFFLVKQLLKVKKGTAMWAAVAVSGAIFSAAHFVSPGEGVSLMAFVYRLLAGMVMGFIFLVRGFGIAAWTHALYDVYVLCFTAQGG